MSRKDPRRRMVIPLSKAQRIWLRQEARGGSLADVLRRLVQQEMQAGRGARAAPVPQAVGARRAAPVSISGRTAPEAVEVEQAGLPLQLPRNLLALVQARARLYQSSPAAIVCQILDRHICAAST